jgi:hypothetical protein
MIFMQNAWASFVRFPKFLAHALAQNELTFLGKGAHGFTEIPLWGSSRPWAVFEGILRLAKLLRYFFAVERHRASWPKTSPIRP